MTNLANQIAALSAAATPGEWRTHGALRGFKGDIFVPTAKQVQDCHHIARLFADKPKKVPLDELQVRVESNEAIRQIEANAALIVALRNAVPQIIAAIRAAAEVDALRAALHECSDKLWVLRCNSRDELDRKAAEVACEMARKALEAKP